MPSLANANARSKVIRALRRAGFGVRRGGFWTYPSLRQLIHGIGAYGFMLSAIDGQVNGGGDLDKFRIKIWNKGTDVIVYDNQMGDTEDADPATILGGGQ